MIGVAAILLIEDDPGDVLLLQLALERLKYECRLEVVPDGLEALEYLNGQGPYADRARFPFPRLILLDLRMPRMDGFEFLQWLRIAPELRSLPVIVITSSAVSQHVSRAYRAGANSFLVKSADLARFTEELKQALDFWMKEEPDPGEVLPPRLRPEGDIPPLGTET